MWGGEARLDPHSWMISVLVAFNTVKLHGSLPIRDRDMTLIPLDNTHGWIRANFAVEKGGGRY